MSDVDAIALRVVDVVQAAIRAASGNADVEIRADDTMETVPGWDSLTFMSVWSAVNEAFGIDPDFDDAIHYISVPALIDYLREQHTQ